MAPSPEFFRKKIEEEILELNQEELRDGKRIRILESLHRLSLFYAKMLSDCVDPDKVIIDLNKLRDAITMPLEGEIAESAYYMQPVSIRVFKRPDGQYSIISLFTAGRLIEALQTSPDELEELELISRSYSTPSFENFDKISGGLCSSNMSFAEVVSKSGESELYVVLFPKNEDNDDCFNTVLEHLYLQQD